MSQPDVQENGSARVDLDPLLEFNAEPEAAEAPETPVDLAPAAAAPPPEEVVSLKQRLDQAERSLDRAFTDIGVLKSDLATLVTTIDDIKKRQSRKPEVVMPLPAAAVPQRTSIATIAGIALLVVVLGAAMWGLSALLSDDAPEEVASGELTVAGTPAEPPAQAPEPSAQSPNAIVPVAANVEPAAPAPRVRVVNERPARAIDYVGTLSIDASPPGQVFIDREPAGRTPLRIEKLRAGSHLVWIERDGYRRWTRVVTVGADRISRVAAQLDPLSR